eukprot:2094817-Rhodomonas_salina.1
MVKTRALLLALPVGGAYPALRLTVTNLEGIAGQESSARYPTRIPYYSPAITVTQTRRRPRYPGSALAVIKTREYQNAALSVSKPLPPHHPKPRSDAATIQLLWVPGVHAGRLPHGLLPSRPTRHGADALSTRSRPVRHESACSASRTRTSS